MFVAWSFQLGTKNSPEKCLIIIEIRFIDPCTFPTTAIFRFSELSSQWSQSEAFDEILPNCFKDPLDSKVPKSFESLEKQISYMTTAVILQFSSYTPAFTDYFKYVSFDFSR